MKELIRKIEEGTEVRNNLSDLVSRVKEEGTKPFYEEVKDAPTFLYRLFNNEDPKVRKNAAKLAELLPDNALIGILWEALAKEGTRYVRPAILLGFKGKDISELKPDFKMNRDRLLKAEVSEEDRKHVLEEIQAYNDLLVSPVLGKHRFKPNLRPVDVLLTSVPEAREVLFSSVAEEKKKLVAPGVMVRTASPEELRKNRLYKELFFVLPGLNELPEDPYVLADKIASGKLTEFLKMYHDGDPVWRYRVNLRIPMEDRKKNLFLKRFTGELSRLSGGKLINDGANYELELRILSVNRSVRVLIGLATLKDDRFSYRKGTVAASIHPVDAAVMMKVMEPHFRKNSQVLDPFCGVGTMLIERNMISPISPVYGIDTFGEAIDKAEVNLKKAGLRVNLIQRDFFDFRHDYLFDEIITNMPFTLSEDHSEIERLYRNFFVKAKEHLKEDGMLFLYAREPELVRECAPGFGYRIIEDFPMHKKENAAAFALSLLPEKQ